MRKIYNVWDLLKQIQQLKKTWLITDQTPIIYSSDDEGNNYQWCVYLPSIQHTTREPKFWTRFDSYDFSEEATDKTFTCLCLN